MALIIANRVREASIVIGTGAVAFLGAAPGYQTFSEGIGEGNTTYYALVSAAGQWEIGLGTLTAGQLVRTVVMDSSSGGEAVSFAAGSKDVFTTLPAGVPALVATLSAPTGSAGVGFQPAGTGAVATTVQNKLRESVSVKDFGAVGDGVADDTVALTEAHVYANSVGRSVSYAGVSQVAVQADAQIVVNTSVDFQGCEFVLLNGIVADPAFNTHNVLFRVYDAATPLATTGIVRGDCSLVKGEHEIFGVQPAGYYFLECDYLVANRSGSGTSNYTQCFRLDEGGVAQYPLSADCSTATVVTVEYRANPAGGRITLTEARFRADDFNNQICFKIERNRTTVRGLTLKTYATLPTTGEDVNATLWIENAADIDIEGGESPGRVSFVGGVEVGGTYIIQPEGAANLTLRNFRASSYNSVTGSNNINGLHIYNCVLRRVDCHTSGHNIFVYDSELQDRGIGIGWGGGRIVARGVKVYDTPIVSDREDYGGSWFGGNIDVQDCESYGSYYRNWFAVELCKFTRVAVGEGVGSAAAETYMPDSITVKNVVRKAPLAVGGNQVVGGLRMYTDNDNASLLKVYAPKHIHIDSVRLEGISNNHRFGNYIALREMWPSPSGITQVTIKDCPSYPVAITAFNINGKTLNTGVSTGASAVFPTQSQAAKMRTVITGCDYIAVECTTTGGEIVIHGGHVQRVKCSSTDGTQRQAVYYHGVQFYVPILEGAETLGQTGGFNPSAYFPTIYADCIVIDNFDLSGASALSGVLIRATAAPTLPATVTAAQAFDGWKSATLWA